MKYITPQIPNSTATVTASNEFSINPNIVLKNSFAQLKNIPEGKFILNIFSEEGKLLQQFNTSEKNIFISSEIFKASGEYFIQLKSVTHEINSQIQKLIVL